MILADLERQAINSKKKILNDNTKISFIKAKYLRYVQAGSIKRKGTRDQIAIICCIIEKAREFQKNFYFCFIYYAKAFGCVDHNKLWKILKEMGIPDHLTCLLRNLYAGQEATVRIGHGTTDWFQIRKGVLKAVYCHPAYFTYMQIISWETLG